MQGSIGLRRSLRIASDATKTNFWGHAWLEKCQKLVSDAVFEKQASENNEKTGTEKYPLRSEKRVKTYGFRNISENKKQGRTCCALDGTEAQKTRKRMFFDKFLRRGRPAKAP